MLIILGLSNIGICQTRIKGRVTDAVTREPIPFASVSFKNTTIGTSTNISGYYVLETFQKADSIAFSCVGYQKTLVLVVKNKEQIINIALQTGQIVLDEITILPGENPAVVLLKKVIENRDKNDHEKLSAYQCEVYNKIEFDVDNITEEFKNKNIFRPFKFVFNNMDSSKTSGKEFLPFFITESISEYYYQANPKKEKEIMKATKVSGIENESVSQFLGSMYQLINVYENFINLLGKMFVSPISEHGLFYYRYYLVDSMSWNGNWCYKIQFKPRRKQTPTFLGDIWIHDTTFAVKKVDMHIADDANVNFVEYVFIGQEFELVNGKQWIISKDEYVVDFVEPKKTIGLIGHKSTSYKNFILNQPKDDSFFASTEDVVILEDAYLKDDEFWEEARHDTLTKNQKMIYHMIDTIQKVPIFRTYVDIIELWFTGYKNVGKFDFGPYYTLVSANLVEGYRFRGGVRTNSSFSPKLKLESYLAYGTKDQKLKYDFGVQYVARRKPRKLVGFHYMNDVIQSGKSELAFREDNLFTSILRKQEALKLTNVEEEKIFTEYELGKGFSTTLIAKHELIKPLGNFNFDYYYSTDRTGTSQKTLSTINNTEFSMLTRYAYLEKFIEGKYGRVSLGSDYPIVQLKYGTGVKGFLDSRFNYHKLIIGIDGWYYTKPFGYSKFMFLAGKIWGKLPYPLLEVHLGNETYMYDPMAYNLMNYYEFASDIYASLTFVHHFEGYFFDKVPLFRKLKFRELIIGRIVYGNLNTENKLTMVNTGDVSGLSKIPYIEAGVGVENILRFIQINAFKRFTYLNNPNVSKYDIRFGVKLSF